MFAGDYVLRDILGGVAEVEKPRIFQGGKDMGISMGIIVVLMVGVVAFTGLCTFNPGAPENGPVQEVDADAFMKLEAQAASFPVVKPADPEGWVTNSARRSQLDGQPAPVVGWVTDDGGYIQMTQTDVPLEDAVANFDTDPRQLEHTEDIAGHEVQIYGSEEYEVRDLWAVDAGPTRLLFSGAAPDEEFREITADALNAEPLEHDPQPAP